MITRGTTPTQKFNTSIDLSSATVIYVSYKQHNKVVIERTVDNIVVTSTYLQFALTQEESLSLDDKVKVEIQIRAKFPNGTAVASNIIEADAGKILKGGVI